ncbi:hypothetical protein [Microscilla marina]|nr:hypothetical protein [Microscilla marina]
MPIPIVESDYFSIYFTEEFKLFEQFWYASSQQMTEADYKRLHYAWVQKLIENKYNIQYFYLDNRANHFVISKELQQWHAQHIAIPVLNHLPNPDKVKVAMVVSEDFVSQLSIEHTVNTHQDFNQVTYYFTNPKEAQNWLLKQD